MIRIRHVQYGEFSAEVVTPRPLPSCEVAAPSSPDCSRPTTRSDHAFMQCMHAWATSGRRDQHRIASHRIARNSTTRLLD